MKTLNSVQPLSKSDYKQQAQKLRVKLLQLQLQLSQLNRPVLIIIAGDHRSARHDAVHTLLEWLDPRFVQVNAYNPKTQEQTSMPFFWRFWRDLPKAGQCGIFMREWTSQSLVQFLNNDIDSDLFQQRVAEIVQFENTLINEGAIIVKFWLHLSQQAHQARVEQVRDTPFFEPKDELAFHNYQHATDVIENTLKQTKNSQAPWHIIASEDDRQRDIVMGEQLAQALEAAIQSGIVKPIPVASQLARPANKLDQIDLSPRLAKADYAKALSDCQTQIHQLTQQATAQGKSIICVFEGADAAGKGGAIRRLVSALDVSSYRIIPIAKPTDDEASRHYLWRFWRRIPRAGQLAIFDRSWYGRVLVERVEGFATTRQWQRAYEEINAFEAQLHAHGIMVLKFWLHIDQDEQLKRFKAREVTAHKQHKITAEDYRNRQQWPAYYQAIGDMLEFTHQPSAPWYLISAQDKKFARIEVLNTIIKQLKNSLKSGLH